MVWEVEIQVKAGQVTVSLLFCLVDQWLWENHAACFVMRMRQREEAGRPMVARLDVRRGHGGKPGPGDAAGQLHADSLLHGLATGHGDASGSTVGQVVP